MSPKISPHLPAQIIAEFAPTAAAQPAASRARTPKLGGNGLPGLLARKAERQQTRQAQPAEPAAQLLHELPSDVLEIIAQKLKTANPKNLAPLKAVNKPLRDVANAVLAADNSVQLSVDMTHIDSQQKFAQIVATAGRLNAHKLSLSGLVTQIDLAALAELPQLRELDLCGITHLNGQHLNGIEKLDQLQSLSIYYPARLNDQDLEKLPRGLKNLYLSRCNNITGASLAGMPCLEKLQIENCAAVNDAAVEGLASSAASLTHLSLANCTAITGVGLGALKNLQKLNAHNCFFLHDAGLQAISENCPTLTWLKLRDCHRISGQVDLRPLKQLQYLSLAATHSCFIDTTKLPVGVTHLDLRQSGFVADHIAGIDHGMRADHGVVANHGLLSRKPGKGCADDAEILDHDIAAESYSPVHDGGRGDHRYLAHAQAALLRREAQPDFAPRLDRLIYRHDQFQALASLEAIDQFETVLKVSSEGVTILLIEQNAKLALEVSHRGYVMESGEITLSGDAKSLLHDPAVRAAYLGEGA